MNTIDLSNYNAHTLRIAASFGRPLKELELLMAHVDEAVRARVAENPELSISHLCELAGDDSPSVRIAVADNSSTPIAILEMLALDYHPDVRYAIAENASVPDAVLRILLKDENPYVASRARETLDRKQSYCNVVLLRKCA